ncbi:MAG: LLM class F420-dependent oxidoreductase, partial [Actinomycetota bacterium]
VGRDPNEIMTSTHLRLDPSDLGPLVDEASALSEAGLDLGIVYLPPPHTPDVLEPLAKALEPIAGK